MTSCWALLLSDDPVLTMTTSRLAGVVGVRLRSDDGPDAVGSGPPGLILLGADRLAAPALPAIAAGVPRVLIAAGEPEDRLWRSAMELRVDQVGPLPEVSRRCKSGWPAWPSSRFVGPW